MKQPPRPADRGRAPSRSNPAELEGPGSGLEEIRGWIDHAVESCRALTADEWPLGGARLQRLAPGLVRLLRRHRPEVARWLGEPQGPSAEQSPEQDTPTRLVFTGSLRALHSQHPYLTLSAQQSRALERASNELVAGVERASSSGVGLAALVGRIRAALEAYQGELTDIFRPLGVATAAGSVSAEYTPELQIAVLGLDLAHIREPILDLGCGEEARLVGHLRAQGKAAVGVDRYLRSPDRTSRRRTGASPSSGFVASAPPVLQPASATAASPDSRMLGRLGPVSPGDLRTHEGAREADWFTLPLLPGTWGTVIAHQSFTLHFLHHHLGSGNLAERYAHRYMEILRALEPGGAFRYAPGLPFLEALLPRELYRVTRREVPAPVVDADMLARWVALLGQSPLYACRVERIG